MLSEKKQKKEKEHKPFELNVTEIYIETLYLTTNHSHNILKKKIKEYEKKTGIVPYSLKKIHEGFISGYDNEELRRRCEGPGKKIKIKGLK